MKSTEPAGINETSGLLALCCLNWMFSLSLGRRGVERVWAERSGLQWAQTSSVADKVRCDHWLVLRVHGLSSSALGSVFWLDCDWVVCSDEKEEEEYEKEEVGEDGEIILVSGDKVSGPWNKSGAAPAPAAPVGESSSSNPLPPSFIGSSILYFWIVWMGGVQDGDWQDGSTWSIWCYNKFLVSLGF